MGDASPAARRATGGRAVRRVQGLPAGRLLSHRARGCRQLFPDQPLPEAARLLARQDLEVFAASPMGRILFRAPLALQGLLMHLPSLYRMVVRGGAIRSAPLADGAVRLEFRNYHGWVDCYTVGTLEGIVLHYDREPRIRVLLEDETHAAYEIRWT